MKSVMVYEKVQSKKCGLASSKKGINRFSSRRKFLLPVMMET